MLRSSAAKLRTAVLESAWVTLAVIGGSSLLIAAIIGPLMYVWTESEPFFRSSVGTVVLYSLQYIFALLIVLIVPFIQLAGKWRSVIPQLGFLRRPQFKDLLLAAMYWVIYFLATFIVLALVTAIFPELNLNQDQEVGFDGISLPYEYILAFIALAILPPLAEEAIFRGYLYGRLRKVMGFWPTTLAVSLTFAIVHLQLNVGIDVFVLSIFLCYLREKTGSIWASVFLHSLKNSVAYYFLFIHQ